MTPSDIIASPSVRSLAGNRGVDLVALAARLGRASLTREDVLAASAAPVAPEPAGRAEPLSRFARVAAAQLTAAAAIPTVTHHDSCDATRVEALRARLRAEGRAVTALAFQVAVLARCLREFPRMNAVLAPDGARLILRDDVHIGVAVDTPHGLMVPVIRHADRLPILGIAAALADLAGRAQERRVRPAELGDASMSVSNLGGIGGEAFTPMLNPPEVAILGISRLQMRPVWDGAGFVPQPRLPLDLTYDHRVLNGADAARVLARFVSLYAAPELLLLRADGSLVTDAEPSDA